MRLKVTEYELLKRIHWELKCAGRDELAAQLNEVISRYEDARERFHKSNRAIQQKNREAGYTWRRPEDRPKKSKYYPAGQESINNAGIPDQN